MALLTFSEFGRRVAENASLGTDHGAAAPLFVVGHRPMPKISESQTLVTTGVEDAVGRLEDVYDSRADSLRKQIRRLRNQKAKAEGVIVKAQIQEAIDRRVKRLADDRKVVLPPGTIWWEIVPVGSPVTET